MMTNEFTIDDSITKYKLQLTSSTCLSNLTGLKPQSKTRP